MPVIIVLVLAFLVLIALAASIADSTASAMQAQAAIEAAQAAKIASAGQTTATFGLTLAIGFLIITNIIMVIAIVVILRNQTKPKTRWAPGPDAKFKRLDDDQYQPQHLPQPRQNTDRIMEMILLKMLTENRQPQPGAQLPAETGQNNQPDWRW